MTIRTPVQQASTFRFLNAGGIKPSSLSVPYRQAPETVSREELRAELVREHGREWVERIYGKREEAR